MAKRLRPFLRKRRGKSKIFYPSDYGTRDNSSGGGEAGTWILATGVWRDEGIWDDTKTWID